jgi:hypothetical protein
MFAIFYFVSEALIRLSPHPLGFRRRDTIRPVVFRPQPPVQLGKPVVCSVQWSTALNRVAKSITMPTREQPPGAVELRDLPAAIHSVAAHVAYEPRPFAAKAARGPADWHGLMNGLPFLAG